MRRSKRLILLMGVTVSILLAGCNKLEEYLGNDPLATMDYCRVEKMTYTFLSNVISVTITYNAWGDPVSVKQSRPGTGHPDGIFRYDAKHRLTDYIGDYGGGGFEYWHRYVYDKNDRVIRDTSYFLGSITNDGPANYYDGAVIYYEYDKQSRIVHTTQDWFSFPDNPLETYYSYDAKGNLVVPGAVYDNKICINRTNRIWMFIDRNYSINNAYATAWNEYGLPTKMELNSEGGRFAGFYYGNLDSIEYKCK